MSSTTDQQNQSYLDFGRGLYADRIPAATLDGIRNYVLLRVPPGGFLSAVLANDLFGAVGRADVGNHAALEAICEFIYNYCPWLCWGSPERIKRWLAGTENEPERSDE